jgi:hypothetical protein
MKVFGSLIAAVILAVMVTAPTVAADRLDDGTGGTTGTIKVMKHVCPENIQSEADFDALGGFLEKVLACPVITREGDTGTGAANGGQINFDFVVRDSADKRQRIGQADFMAAKLCETDLNADADGDGNLEGDVCVDVSHYVYNNVALGDVRVQERTPPAGYRFGSLEFTPNSGDEASLISVRNGQIRLNTANDQDVMVHVYNFKGQAGLPATGVDDVSVLRLLVPTTLLAAGFVARRSSKLAQR